MVLIVGLEPTTTLFRKQVCKFQLHLISTKEVINNYTESVKKVKSSL